MLNLEKKTAQDTSKCNADSTSGSFVDLDITYDTLTNFFILNQAPKLHPHIMLCPLCFLKSVLWSSFPKACADVEWRPSRDGDPVPAGGRGFRAGQSVFLHIQRTQSSLPEHQRAQRIVPMELHCWCVKPRFIFTLSLKIFVGFFLLHFLSFTSHNFSQPFSEPWACCVSWRP